MSVVNCRVKYIRPKYTTLKEWMADSNNVYVGRAGIVFINGVRFPEKSSLFCNPFKVSEPGKQRDGTIEEVKAKFEAHLKKLLEKPENVKALLALKGKNLGCWCAPKPCHADILLEYIEKT